MGTEYKATTVPSNGGNDFDTIDKANGIKLSNG